MISTGIDVPLYVILYCKTCVNALGLGLGAKKGLVGRRNYARMDIWCEWFEGRHLSIDYKNKNKYYVLKDTKEKIHLLNGISGLKQMMNYLSTILKKTYRYRID